MTTDCLVMPFELIDEARDWWSNPSVQAVSRRRWLVARDIDPDDLAAVLPILRRSAEVSSLDRARALAAFSARKRRPLGRG